MAQCRMRTTVDIPDDLYRRLKARAAGQGSSTRALILRGVEQIVGAPRHPARRRVAPPLVPSKRPGTLHLDNARIYDVISLP